MNCISQLIYAAAGFLLVIIGVVVATAAVEHLVVILFTIFTNNWHLRRLHGSSFVDHSFCSWLTGRFSHSYCWYYVFCVSKCYWILKKQSQDLSMSLIFLPWIRSLIRFIMLFLWSFHAHHFLRINWLLFCNYQHHQPRRPPRPPCPPYALLSFLALQTLPQPTVLCHVRVLISLPPSTNSPPLLPPLPLPISPILPPAMSTIGIYRGCTPVFLQLCHHHHLLRRLYHFQFHLSCYHHPHVVPVAFILGAALSQPAALPHQNLSLHHLQQLWASSYSTWCCVFNLCRLLCAGKVE